MSIRTVIIPQEVLGHESCVTNNLLQRLTGSDFWFYPMCSKAARSKLAGMGVGPTWTLDGSGGCSVAGSLAGNVCNQKGLSLVGTPLDLIRESPVLTRGHWGWTVPVLPFAPDFWLGWCHKLLALSVGGWSFAFGHP